MKILRYIDEGRREEILGKDPNQFRMPNSEEVDSPFHKKTNYKYLRWDFDQFNKNPDYSFEEISNFAERFDKLSKNLIKKDIYQYKDLNELLDIFKFYGSTKEEKKAGKKVIFDDENFLVVRPLTQDASCYYGANTKWCTSSTKEGKNKFDQYSSTGKLYYIISKKPLDMRNLDKVAVYVDDYYGWEVFYDNTDLTLNKGQSEQYLSLLSPNLMNRIRDDHSQDGKETWSNLKSILYNYQYFKFKMQDKVVEMWGENDKLNFTINGEQFYGTVEGDNIIFYSLEKPIVEELPIKEFLRPESLGLSFKHLVYLSFTDFLLYFIRKYS